MEAGSARRAHFERMIQAVALWVWPVHEAVAGAFTISRSEEDLLAACKAVLALATIHPPVRTRRFVFQSRVSCASVAGWCPIF